MLVLSRKETQKIRLGDSIVITVVRLSGDKVRLGIQAPKEMLVLRDELETFSEIEADVVAKPKVLSSSCTSGCCSQSCQTQEPLLERPLLSKTA